MDQGEGPAHVHIRVEERKIREKAIMEGTAGAQGAVPPEATECTRKHAIPLKQYKTEALHQSIAMPHHTLTTIMGVTIQPSVQMDRRPSPSRTPRDTTPRTPTV